MIPPSSRARLTPFSADHFTGTSLFDRIARAVCQAGCLPAKELYEAWEVARQTRRRFKGGRVLDLACGHGLLAQIMLLLDETSPQAVAVDLKIPDSAEPLHQALCAVWPKLKDRVQFTLGSLDSVAVLPTDVVVSAHACGDLTDVILQRASDAGARVAVLPCCHHLGPQRDASLEGWVDGPLAMDVERAIKLRSKGYQVWTRTIPEEITPKNRLLLGAQPALAGSVLKV